MKLQRTGTGRRSGGAMKSLPRLLLLLLQFPASLLLRGDPGGSLAAARDLTEDEETVEDSINEDEDDEAEVEDDEPTYLAEDKEEEDVSGEPEASPSADTTILFVKGEGERGMLVVIQIQEFF